MATVSINKKREILDSAKGQVFSVVFEKADGTIREMQCKKWMEKALASGDRKIVGKSTTAHKPNLYSACDIKLGEFRSINLDKLKSATIAGITYVFNDQ